MRITERPSAPGTLRPSEYAISSSHSILNFFRLVLILCSIGRYYDATCTVRFYRKRGIRRVVSMAGGIVAGGIRGDRVTAGNGCDCRGLVVGPRGAASSPIDFVVNWSPSHAARRKRSRIHRHRSAGRGRRSVSCVGLRLLEHTERGHRAPRRRASSRSEISFRGHG